MEERKTVIFKDLGTQCTPVENISTCRENGKWHAIEYETGTIKGTMLSAVNGCHPEPVVLKPNLTGWYNIYLGAGVQFTGCMNYKLTNDDAAVADLADRQGSSEGVNEHYWKSADMTGQDITVSRYLNEYAGSQIAWFRFEPMTDEQVEAYKNEFKNKKNKRLNATNDGNVFSYANMEEYKMKWFVYKDTDFESLSFEISSYGEEEDKSLSYGESSYEAYRELIKYAHELDMKLFISMRMGLWGAQYPFGGPGPHSKAHPEWRCIDREDTELSALSYAFEGTQDIVINNFLKYVPLGCDAVELLYNRGVPYILFEKPFMDAFEKKYPGENPKLLAHDNPKIMDVKCDLMTGFIKRLRAALDKKSEELGIGRVGINVRCNYSIYDNKLIGLDVERWAAEGLIDRIISYPLRVREIFEEDVWADEAHEIIDIEKYKALILTGSNIMEREERVEFDATPDSKGNPAGPANQRERVEEFTAISKKYNIPVYYDLLPRVMSPVDYQRRAVEMYSYGAEYFSFWDTVCRTDLKYEWNMLKRLGHKEELADMDHDDYCHTTDHRILKIDGMVTRTYAPIWGG